MKILVLASSGLIAPYIIDSFIRSLLLEGHEVQTVVCPNGFPPEMVSEVSRFKPDFALAYGYIGCIMVPEQGFLLRLLNIPLVSLHYDNPFLELTKEMENEYREYPSHYVNFIWDRTYLDFYRSAGLQNGHHIMLAIDEKYFFPQKSNAPIPATCFVGAIGDPLPPLSKESTAQARFIHEAIQGKRDRLDISMLEICSKLFPKEEYRQIEKRFIQSPYHFWSGIYRKINALGSAAIRRHVINGLQGIELHVYGSPDWGSKNVTFHGKVPYGEKLADVYRKYAVSINISSLQLETSLNNRPFDVFAAGGFVLNDYREDLQFVFPDHWEQVTYRSVGELQEKCEYFLSHEKERKELSDELGEIVRASHTYGNRVRQIIDSMKELQVEGSRENRSAI